MPDLALTKRAVRYPKEQMAPLDANDFGQSMIKILDGMALGNPRLAQAVQTSQDIFLAGQKKQGPQQQPLRPAMRLFTAKMPTLDA